MIPLDLDLHSLNSWLRGLAPALANHLWQSTAFVAAAGLLALALRNNQARTRHWIWMAASLKFLLPFALLAGIAGHFAKPRVIAPAAPAVYSAVEDFSEPFAVPVAAPVVLRPHRSAGEWLPIACAAVWLAGFIAVLIVWVVRWRRVARTVCAGEPMPEGREVAILRRLEQAGGVRRPMRIMLSQSAMEPGVFGIARPVLAWPAGISERLDDAHMETVLAHEVCHVRQRDNLTAMLHMFVEAAFWFHPLVWWMGARLVAERERACDEEVLQLLHRPHVYAESILKVCEFCVESPLECVAGVTGADLKKRIVEIMRARAVSRLTWGKKLLIGAAMVCAIAAPMVLGQAKAAQRMAAAMLKAAPAPVQSVARAMIGEEQTLSSGEIPAGAQTAAALDDSLEPSFEVATIKPANPNDPTDGFHANGRHIFYENQRVVSLIAFAYGLRSNQVVNAPDWVEKERYDVQGVTDQEGEPNLKQQQAMTRKLLAERFQLKLHHEKRALPVYTVAAAKGGLTLAKSSGDPNGMHDENAEVHGTQLVLHFKNASIADFALELGSYVSRPVVDLTGVAGRFDFNLRYTFDEAHSVDPNAPPGLFTAVQEQMGLKMDAVKTLADVVVVDGIERPSMDGAEVAPPAASVVPVAMMQEKTPTQSQTPEFAVSTVKPSNAATSDSAGIYTGHGRLDGQNVTLKRCIIGAYGVGPHQVVGGPDWVNTLRWDIEAKADQDINDDSTLNAMQADLIADRFKLVLHKETRTLPAYVLEVGKGGPRFKAAQGGDSDTEMNTGAGGRTTLKIGNTDMNLFAAVLARRMDLPVVNETGLKGIFNFELTWTPDDTKAANGPDAVSIFTAIQELGLRLRRAEAPVEVLVIDHAEMPSAN